MEKVTPAFEELTKEALLRFNNEVDKLSDKISFILEQQTKHVLDENKKNVSGKLRASIKASVNRIASGYVISCFSTAGYAASLNEGTKPHFPPVKKISMWVKEKGLTAKYSAVKKRKSKTDDEYEKLAWAVAKTISRKGTKAFRFFEIALKQSVPLIEKELQKITT